MADIFFCKRTLTNFIILLVVFSVVTLILNSLITGGSEIGLPLLPFYGTALSGNPNIDTTFFYPHFLIIDIIVLYIIALMYSIATESEQICKVKK